MKSFRRFTAISALLWIASAVLVFARLRLPAENAVGGSAIEAALFRLMDLPGGAVLARRPAAESVAQVSRLLQQSPERSDLYAIRAQQEERALDVANAENDWRRAADLARDRASALVDLADFYRRRLDPAREVDALLAAARLPTAGMDRFRPDTAQPSWQAFGRAIDAALQASLPLSAREQIYESWISHYPRSPALYTLYLDVLARAKDLTRAQALAASIVAQFPDDSKLRIESEAKLASIGGGSAAELAVYSRRFTPVWPAELRTRFYELLKDAHQLRSFLADVHTAAAGNPTDLSPVLRIYFYYEQENKREAANEELLAWRSRRIAAHSPTSVSELAVIAPLFERVGNYDESARAWYTIYESQSAQPAEKEQALSSLISLLLDVPEQPLKLGQRDLSLYQNVAQMDAYPGFLNGILSLALNTTFPQYEYQSVSQTAVTYFHRAAAARLIDRLKHEFPQPKQLGVLQAKLFNAYAVYGQHAVLIRLLPSWLQSNKQSPAYVSTAMLLADAYSAMERRTEEFALYDRLLEDLAQKGDHVPLGPGFEGQEPATRSADYARVLDRYISRLTQARRLPDAIALYKKEIDRNPDDPGLYQRLALFVEQNRLDAQLVETYRAAFDRFKDVSWADKLARLYLRRKQYSEYRALAIQITDTFDGSALAAFVGTVAPNPRISPVLYRQINLYAHQRFPHDLTFVRNLLLAYRTKATANAAAYDKLLRENWFYDANLRVTFFEYLSRTGKLRDELAALPPLESAVQQKNAAAVQMRAEGLAWLTQFESGAPAFSQLAEFAPGDHAVNVRSIALERSLAPHVRGAFDRAIALAEQDVKAGPADSATLARVGEIYADRDLMAQAGLWWNRVAGISPGSPDGYLQAATIFWDYFQFNGSLRLIEQARRHFDNPAQFAYEAGAIYENEGNFSHAIDEYVRAALTQPPTGENGSARSRLITLARRKETAALVEQSTADFANGAFNSEALDLRVALLENQGRREDIHHLLNAAIPRASNSNQVDAIKRSADRFGFQDSAVAALVRGIALTNDPVEKIRARVELALFRESHKDTSGAGHDLQALLAEDPDLLGVIRAAVDFYWRQNQYPAAVATLTAAAARAQEPFAKDLRLEAARRASESGEYETARQLLDQLLATDPYNPDLLAQKAATYARANDSPSLLAFYTQELKAFDVSPLPATEKADRIAGLRRGYILALISTQQFNEALEQYQQVLNRFPEDESLTREAARFAERHRLGEHLTAYYRKATKDSPKDYRWLLLLARIDVFLGEYEEGVANYAKSVYIRPDRIDIWQAKADLETRLLQFDEAIKTNQKLYHLSYHDARYQVQAATLQARLGNRGEALHLLRAAYLDPNSKSASGYVLAMRQLVSWHLFSEADQIYKELRPQITDRNDWAGEAVALEAQALTCLHRPEDALAAVAEAWKNIPKLRDAGDGSRYAITIGEAARSYLTPEEKARLANLIRTPGGLVAPFKAYDLAKAAGLNELAAVELEKGIQAKLGYSWTTLQQLQSSRLAFGPLGHQLENLASRATESSEREQLLRAALAAYGTAGDTAAELRIASASLKGGLLDPTTYAALFVQSGNSLPARLTTLAKRNHEYANAVIQFLLSTASLPETLSAVRTRGSLLNEPWTQSYTALAGLYFSSPEPSIAASFDAVLGPRTVEAELSSIRNPGNAILRGPVWLSYAARYGDYLSYLNRPTGAELLPAYLESAPAASNSYVALGDTYLELHKPSEAIAEYRSALQLSPERADIYDRMGVVLTAAGQKDQARENWRTAFGLLRKRVEAGALDSNFWDTATQTLVHVNSARVTDQLRAEATAMIRAYLKRNGSYNVLPIFKGMLTNSPDVSRAVDWILQLARETDLRVPLLEALNVPWLPKTQKEPLYRFLMEQASSSVAKSSGDAAKAAADQLRESQNSYAAYLLTENRPQEAWQTLAQVQPPERRPPDLLLKAAALSGNLDELLSTYQAQPNTTPSSEQMLQAAAALTNDKHPESAMRLKEFEYERELSGDNAPAAAYLGLSEARLALSRPAEAMVLLKTVTVAVDSPFENLPEAVHILEKAGKVAEAAQYARQWKIAEPWNSEAQLALARLTKNFPAIEAICRSDAAPYAVRVQSAEALRMLNKPLAGSGELGLLSQRAISAAEASQPFYLYARVVAASTVSSADSKLKLFKDAVGIDPALREPRLGLAEAAFAVRQDPLGMAALDSYVAMHSEGQRTPQEQIKLIAVQESAARAAGEHHEFGLAVTLYEQALANTESQGERTRMTELRNSAQNENRLATLNGSRQPVITDEITQSAIVKPKLTSLPREGERP